MNSPVPAHVLATPTPSVIVYARYTGLNRFITCLQFVYNNSEDLFTRQTHQVAGYMKPVPSFSDIAFVCPNLFNFYDSISSPSSTPYNERTLRCCKQSTIAHCFNGCIVQLILLLRITCLMKMLAFGLKAEWVEYNGHLESYDRLQQLNLLRVLHLWMRGSAQKAWRRLGIRAAILNRCISYPTSGDASPASSAWAPDDGRLWNTVIQK